MPKKVHLEFIVQRLIGGSWVVDLWNQLDGEPMKDCDKTFKTKEEALAWCENYRPGRYPVRTVSVYE